MDERCYYPIEDSDQKPLSIISSSLSSHSSPKLIRERHPAHYTLRIESLSSLIYMLSNLEKEKYDSGVFEVSGYKWRLSLYPYGDKKRNGEGFISLYLLLEDIDNLPLRLEINVMFKFFIYDQIRDKYVRVGQDAEEEGVRRFHKTKFEHGYSQLIRIDTFKNDSNGYLVDDCCEFGVEIFVLENRRKGECMRMLKIREPDDDDWHFSWTIPKFSTLRDNYYRSQDFYVGGIKWQLEIHPTGFLTQSRQNYLSVLICLADFMPANSAGGFMQSLRKYYMRWVDGGKNNKTSSLPRHLYAESELRMVNHLKNKKHKVIRGRQYFDASAVQWGVLHFMLLSDLYDQSKGYLVDDTLIVQVKFNVICATIDFS